MSGESLSTKDRDTIRKWAEERGGKPVRVKDTGVIELDFPGCSGGERSNFNRLTDGS